MALPQRADRVVLGGVDGKTEEGANVGHGRIGSHTLATRVAEDALSASWLAVRLGMEPLRLEGMRRAGELIAHRPTGAREHYYPLWQFDEEWQVLPIVPRLVREA